jgi:glycosyltransferase involved in cell wall biosynthesis
MLPRTETVRVPSSVVAARSILMIAPCPFPTSQGSQTLIRQLAAGLQGRGHTVHLVTYHHGEYQADFDFPVYRTRRLPGTGRLKAGPSAGKLGLDWLLWRKARAVGLRVKPDLVHGHNYEGALIGALVARRLGVPLVYHTHNVLHEELPTYFRDPMSRRIARWLGMFLDRRIPVQADAVVALNDAVRDELTALGVRAEVISVIPPGVWPEEWPPAEGPPRTASIVYTGNLDNYQNLSILIDSMAIVAREMPDAVLTIVSHERSPRLEARVRSLGLSGSVDFVLAHGFHAVRRWILRSSLAVCTRLPSCGYPIKLVNYLAAGRAVVASRACAHGIVDGETGLIVESMAPEPFAAAILRLLRDPCLAAKLGAAAREMALSTLSWDRALPEIEGLYARALELRAVAPRNVPRKL